MKLGRKLVFGRAKKKPLGDFVYDKVLNDASGVRGIEVFLLEVRRRQKRFPEMPEREAAWLTGRMRPDV